MKRKIYIPRSPHMDANTTITFNRELEKISQENFDPQYVANKVFSLVPVDMSSDPTDERWTRRSFDVLGEATLIKDYTKKGFPRVGETGSESSVKFADVGASFGYTIDELKRAARLQRPLDRDRARMARRAVDNKLERMVATGDTASGVLGLLNLSGTNTHSPSNGTYGSKPISTDGITGKTAAECLVDLKGILHKASLNTREIEKSTRIVMDPVSYRYMSELPFNTFSATSVLDFFLGNNPGVEILTWERLSDAGSNSLPKWIAYEPNPMKLRCIMSIPFEQMDPELDGMEYSILCRARLAGMDNPFPLSVTYADFGA